MSIINVQRNNFLEQLIQRLITPSHQQRPLIWKVVIYVTYDLSCDICFSGSRRADDDSKTRATSGVDCLNLSWCVTYRVNSDSIRGIWTHIRKSISIDFENSFLVVIGLCLCSLSWFSFRS